MEFEKAVIRGVAVPYGPRSTDQRYGAESDDKVFKTAVWEFNYNKLPTANTWGLEHAIPAGSSIIRVLFQVITGFTSTSTTTDLNVGLSTKAGSVIDADGLATPVNLSQTAIATAGLVTVGTGALVNASIGSVAGELTVTPSVDDLTAGRARIIVEYLYAG